MIFFRMQLSFIADGLHQKSVFEPRLKIYEIFVSIMFARDRNFISFWLWLKNGLLMESNWMGTFYFENPSDESPLYLSDLNSGGHSLPTVPFYSILWWASILKTFCCFPPSSSFFVILVVFPLWVCRSPKLLYYKKVYSPRSNRAD